MPAEFKIYTKTGDSGQTSLIGGTRVPKFHPRIDTYGTIDELNSFIGLIRDQEIDQHSKDVLLEIQDRLFTLESLIALDPESGADIKLPLLKEEDVELLEKEIDLMNMDLPELKSFIIPGGHIAVSHCHIARCVCRRAERAAIRLDHVQTVAPLHIKYLNRLSDYLFVLARKISKYKKVEEIHWKPRY
jgi:cob(I)alamin adenosyltransferase